MYHSHIKCSTWNIGTILSSSFSINPHQHELWSLITGIVSEKMFHVEHLKTNKNTIHKMFHVEHSYIFPLFKAIFHTCLLYTSDAADEEDSVDLGGRRI